MILDPEQTKKLFQQNTKWATAAFFDALIKIWGVL